MKIARLRQRFGIAHALCFLLLVALVALRVIDPLPSKTSATARLIFTSSLDRVSRSSVRS